MSKLTRALAVAASLVSIATGVLLLSQEALAQEATSELKAEMTASLIPEEMRAQDRAELKSRLEQLTGFSAYFKQELTDSAGTLLSEGVGQIFLLRPNHFLMHNKSPDELAFYTKDSDLYYYDAMVNQLSITSLGALGANPLMLLADIDNVSWDEYEVLREGEFFTLVPRHPQDVQSLTLAFVEGTSFLSALTIRMDDGNTNFYLFSEQSAQVDPAVFDFKLPDDVEIDDMR
ncbi:MAG: outer membrane lipoprotein chaperone LolA [Anaerobiospirillum sp.]|nr:outer membrane lipoprotein chaperone LolA [Anaerobiospirillum sp.]